MKPVFHLVCFFKNSRSSSERLSLLSLVMQPMAEELRGSSLHGWRDIDDIDDMTPSMKAIFVVNGKSDKLTR